MQKGDLVIPFLQFSKLREMNFSKILLPYEKYHIPQKRVLVELHSLVREFNYHILSGLYPLYPYKCLCGEKQDFDLLATVDKKGFIVPLSVCRKCGMVAVNPHYSDVFYLDLKKHKYFFQVFYGVDNHKDYVFSKLNTLEGYDIYNLVRQVLKIGKDTKILEIGSGAGWNFLPFIRVGAKVKGYEEDKQFVDLAKTLGLDVDLVNLDKLPKEGKFDVIILSNVLNKMFSPLEFLLEVKSLLNESGILYVDMPKLNIKKMDYIIDSFYYFTTDTLRYFMNEYGFKPLEVIKTNEKIAGVFRFEQFLNSKYLLIRNKKIIYKEIRKLRRIESFKFTKKIKNKTDVQTIKLLQRIK